MTRFGKKSLTWLVAGSLVAAGGGMAWYVTAAGAKQAQEALRQVEKSEADLASLKTRLAKWEQTHSPGDLQGKAGGIHIEPVALKADFSPREFSLIDRVLSGMYTENGSLMLKNFVLEFGTGGVAHVSMEGDKIFSPKPPPPGDRIVLLPNADGSPSSVILKTSGGEQVLNEPYAAASVSQEGAIRPRKESAESVRGRYGAVLAAQPQRPKSYILYFASGKNELTTESKALLEKIKTELKTRSAPQITAIGHTDRVGSVTSNDALSLGRARFARELLVAAGIPAKHFSVAGHGEREPLVQTADEVDEPRNRRVEINVR